MTVMATITKLLLTSVLIFVLSEIAKRFTTLASVIASIPISAIFVIIFLHWETGDTERLASFTNGVFWMILPSFVFFLAFPFLLRQGISFGLALPVSIAFMLVSYVVFLAILKLFSIKF